MKFKHPRGICTIKKHGKIYIKFPYQRNPNTDRRDYKTEVVCPIPITKKQKKDAKEKVEALAQKRYNEFWELDKLGVIPDHMKPRKPTFRKIAQDYMKEKSIIEKPPRMIVDCVEYFGDRIAEDILPAEIEEFYLILLKRKVQKHTPHTGKLITLPRTLSLAAVASRKSKMKEIYKFAKKRGLVERNPALEAAINTREAQKLGKSIQPQQKAISYEDFILIYEELTRKSKGGRRSKDMPDLINTAFLTGMRLGELLHLNKSRIIVRHIYPHIILREEDVKSGQGRIVPLMPHLAEMFKKRLKVRSIKGDDRVFHIRHVNSTWRRTVESTGLTHPKGKIRFHDLRSSFVTLMVEAGVAPLITMKIVGHSSKLRMVTGISKVHFDYSDIQLETLYKAIMKLYDYLFEKKGMKKLELLK
jgi:integrase